MTDLSATYASVRRRISALAGDLTPDEEGRVVPSCPEWTVHDLLAHLVGIPEELTTSGPPTRDAEEWAAKLVIDRRGVPVHELVARWTACGEAASALPSPLIDLLCVDAVVHEHDLRAVVDRPGERDAREIGDVMPIALGFLTPGIGAAGLAPLAVDTGSQRWATGEGEPGCTLRVDAWTALRALESRRTADELLALPADGDISPYVGVIVAHSPLPTAPLAE